MVLKVCFGRKHSSFLKRVRIMCRNKKKNNDVSLHAEPAESATFAWSSCSRWSSTALRLTIKNREWSAMKYINAGRGSSRPAGGRAAELRSVRISLCSGQGRPAQGLGRTERRPGGTEETQQGYSWCMAEWSVHGDAGGPVLPLYTCHTENHLSEIIMEGLRKTVLLFCTKQYRSDW